MKAFLWMILLVASFPCLGQDERYYRKIYSNELTDSLSETQDNKIIVKSPSYRIDLNRDGLEEFIKTEKRDGKDYFVVSDHFGRNIIDEQLSAIGAGGVVYRVQLKTISPNTDALVIHYYEGSINASSFVATARIYFLTITGRNLKRTHFYKGPHFFHESEKHPDKYSVKRFSVNTIDYNKDGVKEISISYNNIHRVFFYVADGVWQRI